MPISFIPSAGDVLLCEFGPDPRAADCFPASRGPISVPPEMIKRRHVVVLASHTELMVVAPFSTKEPRPARACHLRIEARRYPFFDQDADSWLKGDMLMAVSRQRLDRLRYDGAYRRARLSKDDLREVRRAALGGLGLSEVAKHL